MLFNTDKCKVVHFGYKNTTAGYSLGDVNIQSGKEETIFNTSNARDELTRTPFATSRRDVRDNS